MTGILEQLRWESLKKRRTDNRLILLYKGLKGKKVQVGKAQEKAQSEKDSHSKTEVGKNQSNN